MKLNVNAKEAAWIYARMYTTQFVVAVAEYRFPIRRVFVPVTSHPIYVLNPVFSTNTHSYNVLIPVVSASSITVYDEPVFT